MSGEEPGKFRLVIGLTGLKAAGKDEFARYLVQRGFTARSCSDEIREEAVLRGQEQPMTRDLIEIGNWGRETSGDVAYWAKRVLVTLATQGHELVVVNGLRHPDEATGLAAIAGPTFNLVGITAPTLERAHRLLSRARLGDPTSLEDFIRLDDTDRGLGQPWFGQQVDRTLALVPWDNLYCNRGTLADYHAWIDSWIEQHLV
ncbi:MAG: hypothetical protein PHT12_04945 [Patescibacteria group bacterium]|nr:hypothetical protein [Patescibacteria group bacterium]